MNKRKLVLGIGILLVAVGGLLAAFAPSGIFNRGTDATITTPFAAISVREAQRPSVGPIVGYILIGGGGLALVFAFAMKSPPES